MRILAIVFSLLICGMVWTSAAIASKMDGNGYGSSDRGMSDRAKTATKPATKPAPKKGQY